jgi:hypothetical protein
MNSRPITQSNDPLLRGSAAAMRRAAIRARKRAQETHTRLVISKNHVVIHVDVAGAKSKPGRDRGSRPNTP